MKKTDRRIASIDILRGFDLFMLLFVHPVLVAISRVYQAPWYQAIMYQLDHEVWQGFRCWDMVMPLFLFMVGASMPFSFAKYRRSADRKKIYWRITRRVILLFILGMIVQGNLLSFSVESLRIYNNTLQAIAVGYLIAAVILLTCSYRLQILITFLLLIVYSLPMAFFGDYSPQGNFAFEVDRIIIGRFRGDLTYTWVWSSLTFGATVMFGALTGRLIKNDSRLSHSKILSFMLVFGTILAASGWLLGNIEPVIKRLWTSTMTIYSAGWSMILMALFYWWIDVRKRTRGLEWLKIYGMNAIIAYCIGEVISFRSVVVSLIYGLESHIGQWYNVCIVFGNCLILFLLLWLMYKYRIFVKV